MVLVSVKEASKKNDQRTHAILHQILCYGGLRLKVTANLPCSSILRTEFLGEKKKKYSIVVKHVKEKKKKKSRHVALHKDAGAQLYAFSQKQILISVYLFPGRNEGQPMHPKSIG